MSEEFKIEYGSISIGAGSSTYYLQAKDTKHSITMGPNDFSVEAEVIVTGSSVASFKSACEDIENEFAIPDQLTVISLSGSTMRSFSHDDNTGFSAEPSIQKVGGIDDTGRSRKYRIKIEGELPGTYNSREGRREAQIFVTSNPAGKLQITLQGVWTAIPIPLESATTAYRDKIDAWAATIIGSFVGTFELGEEDYDVDDKNKVLNFRRVYDQILLGQSKEELDDPNIIRHSVVINRVQVGPEDSLIAATAYAFGVNPANNRLNRAVVRFDFWVAVLGPSLQDMYTKFRNFIIGSVFPTFVPNAAIAIVDEDDASDINERRISGTLLIQWVGSGKGVARLVVNVQLDGTRGKAFQPIWEPGGDMLKGEVFAVPGLRLRTITEEWRFIGELSPIARREIDDPWALNGVIADSFRVGSWHDWKRIADEKPISVGTKEANIQGYERVVITTQRYLEAPSGGFTQSGSGPAPGGPREQPFYETSSAASFRGG